MKYESESKYGKRNMKKKYSRMDQAEFVEHSLLKI